MFRRSQQICIAFALSVYAAAVMAESVALSDPTRPPGRYASVSGSSAGVAQWRLASTLISPQRRSAIINGRSVVVGDRVAGARVKEIQSAWVRLETRKGEVQLSLSSPRILKKTTTSQSANE